MIHGDVGKTTAARVAKNVADQLAKNELGVGGVCERKGMLRQGRCKLFAQRGGGKRVASIEMPAIDGSFVRGKIDTQH
jgi:hypothetical protein